MSEQNGKVTRRDLLKYLGLGALVSNPLLVLPSRAEAFFNSLMIKKKASVAVPVTGVFSTKTYSGNSASQSITGAVDLLGSGGLVWIKRRNNTGDNMMFDTARGLDKALVLNTTAAQIGSSYPLAATSDGFSITSSTDANINVTGGTYVAWIFRKAPKFFDLTYGTKAGLSAAYDFSSLGALGMVMVKRTDAAGDWYIWHRDMPAGNLMVMGGTSDSAMGHFTVSGTTVTLEAGVIADGNYVIYAWAHDSSGSGNIQAISTPNAFSAHDIAIGWEPQYFYYKIQTYATFALFDTVRGDTASSQLTLLAQTNGAEVGYSNQPYPLATGIRWTGGGGSNKAYLMAIRKP